MGACTFVRSAVWLVMLAGMSVSQAQETVSAAVDSTVGAATASDGLQPKVQPLSEAELPKGPTGEAIKAQESARNRQLRAKCKDIPVGTYEKYLCERPEQVELIEALDDLLKQVAPLTPAGLGLMLRSSNRAGRRLWKAAVSRTTSRCVWNLPISSGLPSCRRNLRWWPARGRSTIAARGSISRWR